MERLEDKMDSNNNPSGLPAPTSGEDTVILPPPGRSDAVISSGHSEGKVSSASQVELGKRPAGVGSATSTCSEGSGATPVPPRPKAPARRSSSYSFLRELGGLGAKIGIIVAVAVAAFTFVYGIHYNSEPGMVPAMKDGDLVMYYRWDKSYEPGDLLLLTFEGQTQVRRVVAVAGDTVDINTHGLLVNSALVQEPDIYEKTERYMSDVSFPMLLKADEVFVLGDARASATDSRIYGAVNVKDTKGSVITILRWRGL
ncbi:MAG: signal peptidase I [Dehalococcoidia bacterium]|nr:signal peptidase I [Dehalococcoidia bacterium]